MASVADFVLVAIVLALHTVIAAVITRFFRIRLQTKWGTVIYAAFTVPVVLTVTTLVFAGLLNVGSGITIGSRAMVLALFVGLPAVLGATIDVLYMTPPEEYDLPEPAEN